jgi:hypothetical protein
MTTDAQLTPKMSRLLFPLATASWLVNAPFKVRIQEARRILGEERTRGIISGLKAATGNQRNPSLKELCIALEAAVQPGPALPAKKRQRDSSVLELLPGAEDHGGYGSVTYAVAAIRFYFNQCKTVTDRAAFHTTYAGSIACAKFKDLGIVAAILAGEEATELDIKIFEARAAKDAPSGRPYIRRGRHE